MPKKRDCSAASRYGNLGENDVVDAICCEGRPHTGSGFISQVDRKEDIWGIGRIIFFHGRNTFLAQCKASGGLCCTLCDILYGLSTAGQLEACADRRAPVLVVFGELRGVKGADLADVVITATTRCRKRQTHPIAFNSLKVTHSITYNLTPPLCFRHSLYRDTSGEVVWRTKILGRLLRKA